MKVAAYLRGKAANDVVVPKFVAKAIGESEVNVITALRLFEQAGVAKQWFGLFCGKTDVPLRRVSSLTEIPPEIPCDVCDEEHSVRDHTCKVEVLYTIDPEKLAEMNLRVTAA